MEKSNIGKYILMIISIGVIIIIGEKKIPDIIIPFLFLVVIIKELKYRKELILPTRKTYVEVITVFLCVIVLIWIIYSYAKTFIHYLGGILGIFMFVSTCIKEGIGSKGFISMYKYK